MINVQDLPLLTLGVLSWNRLHYLRATLESAHRCIKYPNIQWIVVDNCSTEPGLAEYLKGLTWVNELVFLKSDHVSAMNEIVFRTRGDVLLIWPDDMQFIVEGDWMIDCVEILMENDWIGSMGLNCQRRLTIQKKWGRGSWRELKGIKKELKLFKQRFRFQRRLISSRGFPAYTYGWKEDGIIGSGIPSLTRTNVWKKLGPWKTKNDAIQNLVDSSGGGETEMLERWLRVKIPWQRALPLLPVSADIINDSTGTKAKVRGEHRYGVYTPPPDGEYYYHIYKQEEIAEKLNQTLPISFEDFVEPLGFTLPLDEQGNLLKNNINLSAKSPIV